MFCKLLKLTNGEDLIVSTEDSCETFKGKEFLDVVDPVQIGTIKLPRGNMIIESYVMQPWIRMAKATTIKIPVTNIVVAVDLEDKAEAQYIEFVKSSGKIEFTPGVPSEALNDQAEDMEEILENLMNDDEEEDGNDYTSTSRSIH